MDQVRKELFRAVTLFEDAPCYKTEELVRLHRMYGRLRGADDSQKEALLEEFVTFMDSMKKKEDAPERIYLWDEQNMPVMTDYTDNSEYRYNHNPDFKPYFYEMPAEGTAKGAIVMCAGGDHGDCTLHEAYQSCLDFQARGYHCFMLLNRTNLNPYSGQECGADSARVIRYIRANAKRLGIRENQVAFIGFSNGGLTGEACIQYYSGKQTVQDHFPSYTSDALDAYYGAPDAFLCIYGPRWAGTAFDYERVVYPPTFFAVGREDSALQNLNATLIDLLAHDVTMEIHTFSGVPHGQAGVRIFGENPYPTFELWLPLADKFMQDIFA